MGGHTITPSQSHCHTVTHCSPELAQLLLHVPLRLHLSIKSCLLCFQLLQLHPHSLGTRSSSGVPAKDGSRVWSILESYMQGMKTVASN